MASTLQSVGGHGAYHDNDRLGSVSCAPARIYLGGEVTETVEESAVGGSSDTGDD